MPAPLPLLMDRAYQDDQTRQLALDFGWIPVVPPKRNRLEPWEYDRVLYRRRNEVERRRRLMDDWAAYLTGERRPEESSPR